MHERVFVCQVSARCGSLSHPFRNVRHMTRTNVPHLRLVPVPPSEPGIIIDCDACVAQFTDACDDCLVSYLVGHETGTPVVLDQDEQTAVGLLVDGGLVPPSRFASRNGVA